MTHLSLVNLTDIPGREHESAHGYDRKLVEAQDKRLVLLGGGPSQVLVSPGFDGGVYALEESGEILGGVSYLDQGMEGMNYEIMGQWADAVALARKSEYQRMERVVRVLFRESIDSMFYLTPNPDIRMMGFSTFQTLYNISAASQAAYFGIVHEFPPHNDLGIVFASEEPLLVQSEDGGAGCVSVPYSVSRGWVGVFDKVSELLTLVKVEVDAGAIGEAFRLARVAAPGGWVYRIWSFPPVAILPSGKCLHHRQMVFHCRGPREALDRLSMVLLGVGTQDMRPA